MLSTVQVGLARELGKSKNLDAEILDQLERVQCLLQVLEQPAINSHCKKSLVNKFVSPVGDIIKS